MARPEAGSLRIAERIRTFRGARVILDSDLAALYGVPVKRLNEQVRRNLTRFPSDFSFIVDNQEHAILKSQFATSSWGGRRKLPFAFTEQGVSMLSGVLNSKTAISVHIQIIRVFAKMKQLLLTHKDILLQLEKIEKKLSTHDDDIQLIFKYLKQLLSPPQTQRARIGFKIKNEK